MDKLTISTANPEVLRKYALMHDDEERKTLLLMESPKAKDASNEDFILLISSLYAYLGQTPNEQDIATQVLLLKKDCIEKFKNLSFEELTLALNNALRADTEPLKFLNASNYFQSIKKHLNSPKTLDAKKKVMQRLYPIKENELSDEEKESIRQAGFNRLKEMVLNDMSILNDTFAAACYRWLKAKKIIVGSMFSEGEDQEIKKIAEQILRSEYEAKSKTTDRGTRAQFKSLLKSLENGDMGNQVNVLCQKIALERLIKSGKI